MPGQTVWSTPALVDLNGDHHLDVVVGTGNNFAMTPSTQRVFAFDARTLKDLPGWPVATVGQVSNGPAVGDILGNGSLDVAYASEGARVSLRNASGAGGWNACASESGTCATTSGGHGSVALADLDGDGVEEVVAALDQNLIAFSGRSGLEKANYRFVTGPSIPPSGTPTIAQVDGKAYIAVEAISKVGSGPPAKGDKLVLYLFTTDRPLGRTAWGTFKRTPARAG